MKVYSKETENRHFWPTHCHLMHPLQWTPANTYRNLILKEARVPGLYFWCGWCRSVFIQICLVADGLHNSDMFNVVLILFMLVFRSLSISSSCFLIRARAVHLTVRTLTLWYNVVLINNAVHFSTVSVTAVADCMCRVLFLYSCNTI